MSPTVLRGIDRLVPCGGETPVEDAWLVVDGDRIADVGSGPVPELDADDVDLGGGLLTPGLIDAHTHPVYAGNRFEELSLRSAGASYDEIAATGGGIQSTVAATRAATATELTRLVAERLQEWLANGVTTIEAKSGYYLTREGERASVRLLAHAGELLNGPDVHATFLAAHAVPPEFEGDADGYCDAVAGWAAEAQAVGARFIDVFCDEGYFTVAQARRILEAGQEAGLVPKIHADELAHTGGAALAAELGAASADHLLQCDDHDAAALAATGVVATLCPLTSAALGVTPPVASFRRHGVTLALGTDHNPGMSGTTSMALVIALAVHELGLSVDEALEAATVGSAQSLRLSDRGTIRRGARADLAHWPAEHEAALLWDPCIRPTTVFKAGKRC